jgi:esterase
MLSTDTDTFNLATRSWGSQRPRVLLIHGLGDGSFAWHACVSLIPADISGVCIDLRGHGESPWDPLQRYGTEDLAADVILLLNTLDLRDLTLIGHSLGAEVATRVAATRPDRIRALALVEGGPELNQDAARLMRQQMLSMPRRYDSVAQLEELLSLRYPLVEPTTLRLFATQALRPACSAGPLRLKQDPAFLRGLQTMSAAHYWKLLETLRCSILLVRGRLSSMLSHANAAELPRRLPNCRLVEVPDAGHAAPLENPRGLCTTLTSWLKELSAAA